MVTFPGRPAMPHEPGFRAGAPEPAAKAAARAEAEAAVEAAKAEGIDPSTPVAILEETETRKVYRTAGGGTRVIYPSTTPGAIAAQREPLDTALGYQIAQRYSGLMGGRFTVTKEKDLLVFEEAGVKKGYAGFVPTKQVSTGEFYTTPPREVFSIPSTATYQKGFETHLKQYEIIETPLTPGYQPTPEGLMTARYKEKEGPPRYTTETMELAGRKYTFITGKEGVEPPPLYASSLLAIEAAKYMVAAPLIYHGAKGLIGGTEYIATHQAEVGLTAGMFAGLTMIAPPVAAAVGVGYLTKWVVDVGKSEKPFIEELAFAAPQAAIYSAAGGFGAKLRPGFKRVVSKIDFLRDYTTKLDLPGEPKIERPFSIRIFEEGGKYVKASMKERYGTYEYVTPKVYEYTGKRKIRVGKIEGKVIKQDILTLDKAKQPGFLEPGPKGEITELKQLQLRPKPVDIMYKPEALATRLYPDAARGVRRFGTQYTEGRYITESGKQVITERYDPREIIKRDLGFARFPQERPGQQTFLRGYKPQVTRVLKIDKVIKQPKRPPAMLGLYLDPLTAYAGQVTKGVDLFKTFEGEYFRLRPRFEIAARDFLKEGAKLREDVGFRVGTLPGEKEDLLTAGGIKRKYKRVPGNIFDVIRLPRIEEDVLPIQEQFIKLGVEQLPKQEIRQRQRQILITKPMQDIITEEGITRRPRIEEPPPPPPPPPPTPTMFKLPKAPKKKKPSVFFREIVPGFDPKYFASVEATALGIKGPRPSKRAIATGLPLRPMVK